MTNSKRLTNEELVQIRERAEKATGGNPLKDFDVLSAQNEVIREDIPKLLAEIEVLRIQNESLVRFLHAEGYVPDDDEINWEDVE